MFEFLFCGMQESVMRQEISISYQTGEEKVAMPAIQGLISAWNISTSSRVYHKTGLTVHYAITLKSQGL